MPKKLNYFNRLLLLAIFVCPSSFVLAETLDEESDSQKLETQQLSASSEYMPASFAEKVRWASDGIVSSVMQENHIAGLTLSVVKDGEVVLTKGYGYASLEPKKPVDPGKTLFRIGSLSKTFTWTAIMQLVERGQLDLDQDINQYLKSFQIPQSYGKPLTLNDIMAHRSGFEDGGAGYLFIREAEKVPSLRQMLAQHIPKQVRAPGEAVSYSNYATALAGLIIENLSGQSYDDYIEQHLLFPLAMRQTSFRESLGETNPLGSISTELAADFSTGFNYYGGRHHDHGFEFIHHFGPAGSASSSASDMARYMLAHLNNGELDGQRILKVATVEKMRQRNFDDRLMMTDFAHGFFNGEVEGHAYFGHGGATSTFKTMMLIFPELNFGVFVSINQGLGTAPTYNIPTLLAKTLFPAKKILIDGKPNKEIIESGQKYVGNYMTNRRSYSKLEKIFSLVDSSANISIDKDGYLIRNQAGNVTAWVETSPGIFSNAENHAVMKFDIDSNGSVLRFNSEAGHTSMDKISYFESSNYFFMTLILSLIFSITTLLGFYHRRRTKTSRSNGTNQATDWVGFMASLSGVLLTSVLFLVGSGLGIADFYVWPSSAVKLMIWVSLIASVMFALLAINNVAVWKSAWPLMRKLNRTVFSVIGIATIYALWQWNLLGFYY